jgi:hypothetical protein
MAILIEVSGLKLPAAFQHADSDFRVVRRLRACQTRSSDTASVARTNDNDGVMSFELIYRR